MKDPFDNLKIIIFAKRSKKKERKKKKHGHILIHTMKNPFNNLQIIPIFPTS